jgi:hypothetical protein
MVKLEDLEALDLLIWLQNGITAAALVGTNQSTISRRSKRVLTTFAARLHRQQGTWRIDSPMHGLLDLQRQIHQQVRFRRHRALRLNVPSWSRSLVARCGPGGWLLNPEQGPLVCEQALDLLRGHVIDAALLTPTQLALQPRDDLEVFDLYDTRIDLHHLGSVPREGRQDPSREEAIDLLGCSRLELLPFLPASCCDSSRLRFEQLRSQLGLPTAEPPGVVANGDSALLAPVAFLTPVMALGVAHQRPLTLELDWPYRESLAVLRCQADQPAIQSLVEKLRAGMPRTVSQLVPAA